MLETGLFGLDSLGSSGFLRATLPATLENKKRYERTYDYPKTPDGCWIRNKCKGCPRYDNCPTVNPYKDR